MPLDLSQEYTHRYGGNGLGIVRELEDEWVEVVYVGRETVTPWNRNMTVWSRMLKPFVHQDANGVARNVPIGDNPELEARRIAAKGKE